MSDTRTAFAIALAACAGVAACSRAAPAAPPVRADVVLAADSEILPGRVARDATFGALLSEHDLHAAADATR